MDQVIDAALRDGRTAAAALNTARSLPAGSPARKGGTEHKKQPKAPWEKQEYCIDRRRFSKWTRESLCGLQIFVHIINRLHIAKRFKTW